VSLVDQDWVETPLTLKEGPIYVGQALSQVRGADPNDPTCIGDFKAKFFQTRVEGTEADKDDPYGAVKRFTEAIWTPMPDDTDGVIWSHSVSLWMDSTDATAIHITKRSQKTVSLILSTATQKHIQDVAASHRRHGLVRISRFVSTRSWSLTFASFTCSLYCT
jgi:hypothetical protein